MYKEKRAATNESYRTRHPPAHIITARDDRYIHILELSEIHNNPKPSTAIRSRRDQFQSPTYHYATPLNHHVTVGSSESLPFNERLHSVKHIQLKTDTGEFLVIGQDILPGILRYRSGVERA